MNFRKQGLSTRTVTTLVVPRLSAVTALVVSRLSAVLGLLGRPLVGVWLHAHDRRALQQSGRGALAARM